MKPRRSFSLVLVSAVAVLASFAGTANASTNAPQPGSQRSGTLHVTKNCTGFSGKPYPQSFCMITASNLRAIPVGSKVLYLQPGDIGTPAGSDVILDPPGRGRSKAFGNCALVPSNNSTGVCTFSGGTGDLTGFHATVVVGNLDGVNFTWTGTYAFAHTPGSGTLRVTKNCTGFTGLPFPQSSCVITASNLGLIPVGSKILYRQPGDLGTPAGSDVVLVTPGKRHGKAFGNCSLVPTNNYNGVCTFSGGTGDLTGFHATVVVGNVDGVNYTWTGTYAFRSPCRLA
jgi:hypothetical protein